ncbi:Protein hgh1 [Coemansia javaensis]|uniref:Protein HGH1 homolog n=1 Tax=Coemansia javaensis TaxID=2761396 RepID=A0A9W8LMD6_9FUNG|nr:Protein hgh1 [Coemansia javaensis]
MEQLDELIGFLSSPRPDVRQLAVTYLVGFSHPTSDGFERLVSQAGQVVKPLLVLCHEAPAVAKKAMDTLVNLSTELAVCRELANEDMLGMVVRMITSPGCYIADPACMLLSNLTKLDDVCIQLCALRMGPTPGICDSPMALDQLTDVFVMGMERKYNKNATFACLANVFSNITNHDIGRRYFLERTAYDGRLPITKIMVFSECDDVVRRGGVDATMKNVCFAKDKHRELLDPDKTNMLPYILLPLCGPEDIDAEDVEKMPDEVQFLGADKKREPSAALRATLLEAINLLCSTHYGRETMRAKCIYPILREQHKAETNETCLELNERAVRLIIGDESAETISDADATFEDV